MRTIGRWMVLLVVLTSCLGGNHVLWAGGKVAMVALPQVSVAPLGKIPPAKKVTLTPKLTDAAKTVDKAINRKEMLAFLGLTLTPEQKKFLDTHKFLLVAKDRTRFKGTVAFDGAEPEAWDEMLGMHDQICGGSNPWDRLPENAHLINPDLVLHAFHKYLENLLEHLERTELASDVRQFVSGIRNEAVRVGTSAPAPAAERLQVLAAQFTVPLILLENASWGSLRDPQGDSTAAVPADDIDTAANAASLLASFSGDLTPALVKRVEEELRLIYAAEGAAPSPLFGAYAKDDILKCDYSQFRPRSHYSKSSALRAYFRAMIYLGRNAWLFETDHGITDALLLACLMAGPDATGKPLLDSWRRVMETTGFFAGQADDVGYPEWRNFLTTVLGKAEVSPAAAGDGSLTPKIKGALDRLSPPRILSDLLESETMGQTTKEQLLARTKGFRVFGQRFTLDAWVLGQLTAGHEQAGLELPSTPSTVFLPAMFGDSTARELVPELLQTLDPSFTKEAVAAFLTRLDKVGGDLAKVPEMDWFASLSAAWLGVLRTLTGTYGDGFPLYMRSVLFPRRQLQAFLGSFAELKHDTLLYAKQNYAEYGDGGEDEKAPPVPKGFVEPNLRFWYALQRLVVFFQDGLAARKLLPAENEEYGRMNRLHQFVDLCTTLAEKELQGKPLTEDEYESLRTWKLSDLARPFEDLVFEDEQRRSGLIADVHTDGLKNTVLYNATGEPAFLLVLVGNEKTPRLVCGVAFNPYEFSETAGKRLSDEDWRERVYVKPATLPAKPAWTKDLWP